MLDISNRPDQDFRRALGIDSIYQIVNHVDFIGVDARYAKGKNGDGCEDDNVVVFRGVGNSITPPDSSKEMVIIDVQLNGSEFFSSDTIVQRVLESREILETRQAGKKEPEVAKAADVGKVDMG